MSNFIEVVRLGFGSSDQATREQYERKIIEYRDSQPLAFLEDCIKAIADTDNEVMERQKIILIMMRSLSDRSSKSTYWNVLELPVKNKIKETCLSLLMDTSDNIKRAIAQTIAVIFAREYVDNLWGDLLENLSSNVKNNNIEVKKASIYTFQYICETFKKEKLKLRTNEEIERILYSICFLFIDGGNTTADIKIAALKAVRDSARFTKKGYQDPVLVQKILELVVVSCLDSNPDIQLAGIQCLSDLVDTIYVYLTPNYFEVIVQRLNPLFTNEEESIVIAITEFWNILIRKEKKLQDPEYILVTSNQGENSKKIIETYYDKLLPEFLKNLLRGDIEDEGESALSIRESSRIAVTGVNSLIQEKAKAINMEFIQHLFSQGDSRSKYAGIECYCSFIDGLNPSCTKDVIQQSFENLISMYGSDQKLNVMLLKTFTSMAKRLPDIFFYEGAASVVYERFFNSLLQGDEVLVKWVSKLYGVIASFQKTIPNSTNFYSKKLKEIIGAMLEASCNPKLSDGLDGVKNIFLCLFELYNCISPSEIESYVLGLIERLHSLGNLQNHQKETIKEGFFLIVNGVLWRLTSLPDEEGRKYLSDQTILKIYEISLSACKTSPVLNPDTLNCILAIGSLIKEDFVAKLEETMNMISKALEATNMEIIKVGFENMGHFIRVFKGNNKNYVGKYIEFLLKKLQDPSFFPELKVTLFMSLADVALGSRDAVLANLSTILQMYKYAYEAVITYLYSEEDAALEYGQQFRDAIVESLACITHSLLYEENGNLKNEPTLGLFIEHSQSLNEFFIESTKPGASPSMPFINEILTLLTDLNRVFMETSGRNVFDVQTVGKLLSILKSAPSKHYSQSIDYIVAYFKC